MQAIVVQNAALIKNDASRDVLAITHSHFPFEIDMNAFPFGIGYAR